MAELPGIERDTLDVDVVIVGAGPAGLAAAYRLAEMVKAHNASNEKKLDLSIALLEKGKEIGAHGISGAVMDPRGIAELMPDWLERGCPIESPVTDDAFWYLFETMKIAAPIMPPPLQNHGNYVISLGEFVRWMAPIVGDMSVDLFAEFAAARVLVENGRVAGVRTGDKGIDKMHPSIRPLLEGGKMISAEAKAIPEGGYFSMPRMYGDGFLITGDSAGYLNGARLKGIHLGIKSGAMAAETAFAALVNEDYSSAQLGEYEAMFEASWAREELWKQRNFHQAFDSGQLAGLINAGLGVVTGGRGYGVINRLEGHAGHERMERIQRYFGDEHPHPPAKMKFDGVLTFDKVTDVYNGGVLHEENQPAHLLILDTEVCITRCTEEYGNPCLHFCPAQVYEPQPMADGRGKVPFLNFTNCYHCKK